MKYIAIAILALIILFILLVMYAVSGAWDKGNDFKGEE
jgi:hypothetical protein